MNIVLAHGFLGFRQLVGVEYFNGVRQHLEQQGHRVITPRVDPDSGIPKRGEQLAAQIQQAFAEGGAFHGTTDKAHVLAHSMGGLDARFMLSTNALNVAAQVASLTTIGTPHLGSPIADLLQLQAKATTQQPTGFFRRLFQRPRALVQEPLHQFAEALNLPLSGLHDLTITEASAFDRAHPNHPRVRYFAVAGRGRNTQQATSALLLLSHGLIEGPNDGLVSVHSATRGASNIAPDDIWDADHTDEIGHDLDGGATSAPTTFAHLAAYNRLVARLAAL